MLLHTEICEPVESFFNRLVARRAGVRKGMVQVRCGDEYLQFSGDFMQRLNGHRVLVMFDGGCPERGAAIAMIGTLTHCGWAMLDRRIS